MTGGERGAMDAITASLGAVVSLRFLGANLAAAGALCAAFNLGMTASKDLYWHGRAWWSPGCSKDAAPYLKESP